MSIALPIQVVSHHQYAPLFLPPTPMSDAYPALKGPPFFIVRPLTLDPQPVGRTIDECAFCVHKSVVGYQLAPPVQRPVREAPKPCSAVREEAEQPRERQVKFVEQIIETAGAGDQ